MEATINISSGGFPCCLATSNAENVINSAKLDKFGYISSRDQRLISGLYMPFYYLLNSFGSEERQFI